MKPLILILLLCTCSYGQTAPLQIKPESTYDWHFIESSGTFWAGVTTDWASSRRLHERNMLFRTSGGPPNHRAFWVSNLIGYGCTVALQKNHPKAMNWIRRIMGGVHFGVAGYNRSLDKHQ